MRLVDEVKTWLQDRGTATTEHPGGTLYLHLVRVSDRMRALGLREDVCLAGLAHAAYGTDGFPVTLLDWTDRTPLADLVGDAAEQLVYLYCACDRALTWRSLAETAEVTDRFTGRVTRLDPVPLRDFVDLSIVNELDVLEQSATSARRHGDYYRTLFPAWSPLASPSVAADASAVLERL
jgi:hypothetical protein